MVLYEGNGRVSQYDEQVLDSGVFTNRRASRKVTKNIDNTFTLEFENGSEWDLSAAVARRGHILASRDRLGNEMTFTWEEETVVDGEDEVEIGLVLTKIVDTLKREILFSYDVDGYLISVEETYPNSNIAGRRVDYEIVDDQLRKVWLPEIDGLSTGQEFSDAEGNRIARSYTYYSDADEAIDGKLKSIFEERANDENLVHYATSSTNAKPYLTLEYYPSSGPVEADHGRVKSQDWGNGEVTIYYDEAYTPPGDDWPGETFTTRVIGRGGEDRLYIHDSDSRRIVGIMEYDNARGSSGAYLTRYFYHEVTSQLRREVHPDGLIIDYVYDINAENYTHRSRLLKKVNKELVEGVQTVLHEEEFVYDSGASGSCGCSQGDPNQIIDPLGNVTSLAYYDATDDPAFDGTRLIKTREHPDVDLVAEGFMASVIGGSTQEAMEAYQYSTTYKQLTKYTDPEGNVVEFEYYSLNNYSGSGTQENPYSETGVSESDGPNAGGWLKKITIDTTRAGGEAAASNSYTNPTPVEIEMTFVYDERGNVTKMTDSRGVISRFEYDQHDRLVRVIRDAEPDTPDGRFAYEERYFYDAAGNVVLHQREDRGNTRGVDGNSFAAVDYEHVGLLNTGASFDMRSELDPSGGKAYQETLYKYDIDGNVIEVVEEVATGEVLRTHYRYDEGARRVLTVYPEGNADAVVYDQRSLVFKTIRGVAATDPAVNAAFEEPWFPSLPAEFDRYGFDLPGSDVPSVVTVYNYDDDGRLLETVDAVDDDGLNSTEYGTGDAYRYTYDILGRLTQIRDPLNNTTEFQHDKMGRVIRTISREWVEDEVVPEESIHITLSVREFIYDERGRLAQTHDVLFETPGVSLERSIDLDDRSEIDGLAVYLADAPSDTAAVPGISDITVLGRVTHINEYDRLGRLIFSYGDDMAVTRTDYDGAGRVVRVEDSAKNNGWMGIDPWFEHMELAGNVIEMEYDKAGNLVEMLRRDVSTLDSEFIEILTSHYYDNLSRRTATLDHLGNVTEYRYDSFDSVAAVIDANDDGSDGTSSWARYALGGAASVAANKAGNVTLVWYDGLGRPVREESLLRESGLGNGTFYGADDEGVKQTIPGGYLHTSQGGGDGKITTSTAYDGNGRVIARRDDNGNVTSYLYTNTEALYEMREGVNETGTTLTYTYGSDTIVIPFDSSTVGETIKDTHPGGTAITYDYDADGREVTVVDQSGNEFTLVYDANNRLIEETVDAVSPYIGTTEKTYQYDGLGRMTQSTDNNNAWTSSDDVVATFAYDSLSRIVEETQRIGTDPLRAISLSYDADTSGSVSGESRTVYPGNVRTVNSYYDLVGRLDRRSDNHVGLIGQYEYLGNRVASLTYGNNHRMTRLQYDSTPATNLPTGFDSMGRVIEHRWESGASTSGHGLGTMVMQFEYHDGTSNRTPLYDRVGNRLAEYKAHQPARSELYRYDSASRLADPGYAAATSSSNKSFERGTLVSNRSEVNSGASPYEREGWRLDGVNNWNQYGSNTGGASIGTSIESTAFNEWNLAGSTAGYAGYDDNGNAESYNYVAGASPGIYRWDPWNRLREIDDQYSQKVAEYFYDAHNRRVRKVVAYGGVEGSSDVRNGTTDYAYQGWRVLWENFTPEVMPFAPTGGPTTFVYGNYLDEVWNAMEIDGAEIIENFYFLTGVNYSVMGVIDAYTGGNTLAEAYEYDPYGRHRVIDPGTDATYFTSDDTYDEMHAGAINNSIRYTGQRFDAESNLMYYKNRYYDPAAGRFIGRDPLGWDEGANRYGYVGARPTRKIDPLGLIDMDVWSGKVSDKPTDDRFEDCYPGFPRIVPPPSHTAWQEGLGWLTGSHRGVHMFDESHDFTQDLRKHREVENLINRLRDELCECEEVEGSGSFNYSLSGATGVLKFVQDYSVISTGGYFGGNLSATYLGSYAGKYRYYQDSEGRIFVDVQVCNASSLESATRIPVVGYWGGPAISDYSLRKVLTGRQRPIPSTIFSNPSSGPMATTYQEFRWTEELSCD
jgi:RHS repeat-associated protein